MVMPPLVAGVGLDEHEISRARRFDTVVPFLHLILPPHRGTRASRHRPVRGTAAAGVPLLSDSVGFS
jgi:hypothetical protein